MSAPVFLIADTRVINAAMISLLLLRGAGADAR